MACHMINMTCLLINIASTTKYYGIHIFIAWDVGRYKICCKYIFDAVNETVH